MIIFIHIEKDFSLLCDVESYCKWQCNEGEGSSPSSPCKHAPIHTHNDENPFSLSA